MASADPKLGDPGSIGATTFSREQVPAQAGLDREQESKINGQAQASMGGNASARRSRGTNDPPPYKPPNR